jgi:dTDP-4-dehydrorhamnose reductase
MQKLLLTGASGFLGSYWLNSFGNKYETIALVNKSKLNLPIQTINCDLTNKNNLAAALQAAAPNIIIHAAAISSIANCQNQNTAAYAINVAASKTIAEYCALHKVQLVFTSTDLVFDGKKGNYTETDLANPLSTYGAQKLEAENAILQIDSNALIVRLALQVGNNETTTSGVINDLRNKETAHLFTDEIRTPIHVKDTINAIHFLIEKKAKGIFNIGGLKKFNRFELGLYLKEQYNLHQVAIQATNHLAHHITNRPKDVTLNIDKLLKLGFTPNKEL